MSDVMTHQRVGAVAETDMVLINFGRAEAMIPYESALELSAGLRVACKEAMRIDHEPVANWREISEIQKECHHIVIAAPTHRGFRRSRLMPTVDCWSTRYDRSIVFVRLGNVESGMYWADGLKFHAWLRAAAKVAKKWAGDTGKTMRIVGSLTNAEESYRLNLH